LSNFSQKISKTAMVLAAGKGLRMRPLTNRRPKPLVAVAGRSLIDRAIDRVQDAGINNVVVNLHYRGEMLRRHLDKRQGLECVYSDESKSLLETGGGVKKALKKLVGNDPRPKPFLVLNSDALWLDGFGKGAAGDNALARLAAAWDGRRMDALLLMQPTDKALGHKGAGDYRLKRDAHLVRVPGGPAPYVFSGIQILHQRLFEQSPRGAFSLVRLYDKAEKSGRLFGLKHTGVWMDVGTPDGVTMAEEELKVLGRL
jgi:N-acetyl-alpha-D-muramate 1-phosphate uridylyltransferase